MNEATVRAYVRDWEEKGKLIPEECARTIASYWHSSAERDKALTAFSHGIPADRNDILVVVYRELNEIDQNPAVWNFSEAMIAKSQLRALIAWLTPESTE